MFYDFCLIVLLQLIKKNGRNFVPFFLTKCATDEGSIIPKALL